MVKVTIENDGTKRVLEGELLVGHMIKKRSENTTEQEFSLCGRTNLEEVANLYISGIPSILKNASNDPAEVASMLIMLNERLDEEIKKYLSENAEAIAEKMIAAFKDIGGER